MNKSNLKTELCPFMFLEVNVRDELDIMYYCVELGQFCDEFAACAGFTYDSVRVEWTRRKEALAEFEQECPLGFTYDQINEKRKALDRSIIYKLIE